MKKLVSILSVLLWYTGVQAQDFRVYDPAQTTPYSICATINGDPAVQAGFCWFTNQGVDGQQLQLVAKEHAVEADFQSSQTIDAESIEKTFSYFTGNRKDSVVRETLKLPANTTCAYLVNKAIAKNLRPGTVYSYRVGKNGAWSTIATFRTAPKKKQPYSFLYLADSQSATFKAFEVSMATVHAAARQTPDAKFFLICGDLIETGSQWEWEQWFSTSQDVWSKYLLAPVIGNHDYSKEMTFHHHFNTPTAYNQTASVKTETEGTNYSFVYGDALFMLLNYEDFTVEGYLESLAQWMEKQVKENPRTRWRIVGFHKTMFTGGTGHQKDVDVYKTRALMMPLFRKLNIDLALQGHDHIYEVIGPVDAQQKLVPGAVTGQKKGIVDSVRNMTGLEGGTFNVKNGTLFVLINGAGDKGYFPLTKQQMEELYPVHRVENYFSLFNGKFGQNGEHGFCEVKVSKEKLVVNAFTVNDEKVTSPLDSITIIKK